MKILKGQGQESLAETGGMRERLRIRSCTYPVSRPASRAREQSLLITSLPPPVKVRIAFLPSQGHGLGKRSEALRVLCPGPGQLRLAQETHEFEDPALHPAGDAEGLGQLGHGSLIVALFVQDLGETDTGDSFMERRTRLKGKAERLIYLMTGPGQVAPYQGLPRAVITEHARVDPAGFHESGLHFFQISGGFGQVSLAQGIERSL